jgi:hypothetical protein
VTQQEHDEREEKKSESLSMMMIDRSFILKFIRRLKIYANETTCLQKKEIKFNMEGIDSSSKNQN